MSVLGSVKGSILRFVSTRQKRRLLKASAPLSIERADWSRSLTAPKMFYEDCFRYFHQRLPSELQEHRSYFAQGQRGFGEDAFHTMWFLLLSELKFTAFLEIGVYRGQILSLISLLQKREGLAGQVVGISPFTPAGDTVSRYREDVDYLTDTMGNFSHFNLPTPELLQCYSTDPPAIDRIHAQQWDAIYIDGNHDYEVAKADWVNCSGSIRKGGIIVLDDSGLTSHYRAPAFATSGHPGPSRVAAEIDRETFAEILQVGHNRVFQKRVRE